MELYVNDGVPMFYYDSVKQLKEYEGDVEYRELPKETYIMMSNGEIDDIDPTIMN